MRANAAPRETVEATSAGGCVSRAAQRAEEDGEH
jgi:hypothetical protein